MSDKKTLTDDQQAYHALYADLARAARQLEAATAVLQAHHTQSLIDKNVPPGDSIDWWGDGAIKKKKNCAQAPEVN